MQRKVRRGICLAAAVTMALSITATPTSAITYGETVQDPGETAPWAVSIRFSEEPYSASDNEDGDDFICSGTAINSRTVVTAAHCLEDKGFYAVGIAGTRLRSQELIPVESMVIHSAYRPRDFGTPDIAVVRTLWSMNLPEYARLATAKEASRTKAGAYRTLRVWGWGHNQRGSVTGTLKSVSQAVMTRTAKRLYGNDFRSSRMIAAARLRGAGYSGICSGDSGGPLTVTIGNRTVLVGVSDYSLESSCLAGPGVFASVGDLRRWSTGALPRLPMRAKARNLAEPFWEGDVEPGTITGKPEVGASLTCERGRWTSNTRSVTYAWAFARAGEEDPAKARTGQRLVLRPTDAGYSVTCTVVAKSDAATGEISGKAVAIPVPAS